MKSELISIIVPIFNGEKYIYRLVESVLKQSYQNWQLILVDDGSVDHTSEICKKFVNQDIRIEYIYQKNKGVSAARNNGMDCAKGEYITFVDVDDYLEYDFIETLYKYAAPDKIVKGDREIQKNGSILEGEEAIKYCLAHWNVWGGLYHKTLLSGVYFQERIAIAEDLRFFVEIICQCRIKKIALIKDGYHYVANEISAMHSSNYNKFYTGFLAEIESVNMLRTAGYDFQENNLVLNGTYYLLKSFWSQSLQQIKIDWKHYRSVREKIRIYWDEIYVRRKRAKEKYLVCLILMRMPIIGFLWYRIKRK